MSAERSLTHNNNDMNWIDVKDRLPESDKECIAVLALCNGVVFELTYFPETKKFYCDFPMKSYWEEWTGWVSHWMPLPDLNQPDQQAAEGELETEARKEGLRRASQHNFNQAEAGYNAKWFTRGAIWGADYITSKTGNNG